MEKNDIDRSILKLNKEAMDLSNTEYFPEALRKLKLAEKWLTDRNVRKPSSLWAITYNNLGCVYKKTGNSKAALFYFTKALDCEIHNSHDATTAASTHLNISAILSNLNDHQTSLFHALASLKILQSSSIKGPNYSISVIIAYHSIGLESQYLNKPNESMAAFKKGWEIAEKELGPSHKLTERLRRSFSQVCSIPTMPLLRPGRKILKKKPSAYDYLASSRPSRFSQNSSRLTQKSTAISQSSENSHIRMSYYKVKPRSSLSPISSKQKQDFSQELESINKLIRELDCEPQKPKKRFLKEKRRMSFTDAVVRIQKTWRGYKTRKDVAEMSNRSKLNQIKNMNRRLVEDRKVVENPKPEEDKKTVSRKLMEHQKLAETRKLEESKKIIDSRKVVESQKLAENQKLVLTRKRTRLLRPIPEIKFETKMEAIIKVQSWTRMLIYKKRFKLLKKAAVTIQRIFKGRLIRKLFLVIYDAIVFIQSVFRGYRVRKQYNQGSFSPL